MSLREWFRNSRATSVAGLRVGLPLVLLVIVAMFITWRFIEPAPPHKVVIAGGAPGGAYDHFARQYAQFFKDNGFDLQVKETAGSIENYKLLMGPDSGVDIAIVQGGTTPPDARETLEAVCSIYLEPLWVFYRGETAIERLSQLEGKRLAIGQEGSGARSLAQKLLAANGIDPAAPGSTQLSDLGGKAAVDALKAGQVDAVFLVIAPESEFVQDLIRAPGIHLMSFAQADAYARQFDFLSKVTLYEGAIDLGKNIPSQDMQLIAPTAMLVAKKHTHHGTIELLVQAAKATHASAATLGVPGQFPSAEFTDLKVGKDAAYYLRTPPSWLLGGLPFWLKSLVDRLVLLLIPLLAVALPLLRFAPALFRWSVRSRIVRYYNKLKTVEEHLEKSSDEATLRNDLAHLDTLEHKFATMTIPAGFMPDLYDLRLNTERLRERVKRRLNA